MSYSRQLLCFPIAHQSSDEKLKRYKKAYDSMKACPLPFRHPSEAQQLFGLGPKLCDRLTDKLKEHCTANALPMPELPHKGMISGAEDPASIVPGLNTLST